MTFSELNNQYVWLELQTKNNKSATGVNWASNRIALKCETITINTSKQVISHAIPGSGVIYGESRTAALDLGMTDKTLSINGIITEQTIVKNFDDVNISEFENILESTDTSGDDNFDDSGGRKINPTSVIKNELIISSLLRRSRRPILDGTAVCQ